MSTPLQLQAPGRIVFGRGEARRLGEREAADAIPKAVARPQGSSTRGISVELTADA